MERITITVPEGVQISGLSRNTIYRQIAAGRIETVRIGGRRLIKADSLRRFLSADQPAAA
ncbi:helix-turn-helix domain-containing protein [Rhizorhabdus wittichii]|uniref:Helix-turn-helix domain-containing protein n=1 Tax=Rhizorhabdus wittichii TaxID=160791 RepID=A0A975HEH5_9SPHN|nr:helix-turn-helix domain-containing protein [Rhizorhabdus wittichii]QTH20819.1 helix-turn-helix domain-containing protein [Rhizorhabdus wittichii]